MICPYCRELVAVEVERFEDMFEDPADAENASPIFHERCLHLELARLKTLPDRTRRIYEYEVGTEGPLAHGGA